MQVKSKLTILYIVAAIITLLLVMMGYSLYKTTNVLKEAADWTIHSSDVENAMTDAKGAFATAETRGRYAVFDEESKTTFPQLAVKSLAAIDSVTERVSDNPAQIENAHAVRQAVMRRFDTLNRTINSARIYDGKLQTDPDIVADGVDAQNKVLIAFTAFENAEKGLKLARLQNTFDALNTAVKIIFGLFLATLISTGLGFFWTWWNLRIMQEASRAMERSPSKYTKTEELIKVVNYIEGRIKTVQ